MQTTTISSKRPYWRFRVFAAQYAKIDSAGTLRWHTWSGGVSWEVAKEAESESRLFEPGAFCYRVVPQHAADRTNGKTWNESLGIMRALHVRPR